MTLLFQIFTNGKERDKLVQLSCLENNLQTVCLQAKQNLMIMNSSSHFMLVWNNWNCSSNSFRNIFSDAVTVKHSTRLSHRMTEIYANPPQISCIYRDYAHPYFMLHSTPIPYCMLPWVHALPMHTGGMGLISKTVVLSRNYAHPGVCLKITPTHQGLSLFLRRG